MRPAKNEYFPFYETYISKVIEHDAVLALEENLSGTLSVLNQIPAKQWDYYYEPNKWSIKEVVLHICDVERVFAYRALAFARGETQMLPAFDEDVYALNSEAGARTPEALIEEFKNVRLSSLSLFKGCSPEALQKRGQLPAGTLTVNALAFAICGHCKHHLDVLKARYLK
ncbi:MAG: DinB family protein [Bacteroidia bacterium]|jgi:hypothetical protein|nr:DinB family protein [Bacteroidia bacterium]